MTAKEKKKYRPPKTIRILENFANTAHDFIERNGIIAHMVVDSAYAYRIAPGKSQGKFWWFYNEPNAAITIRNEEGKPVSPRELTALINFYGGFDEWMIAMIRNLERLNRVQAAQSQA